MKTTLRRINEFRPSLEQHQMILSLLGEDLDKEISIKDILEKYGIQETIWFLRTIEDQKPVRLFCIDMMNIVLPESKEDYSEDYTIMVNSAKDYVNGIISEEILHTRLVTAYINLDQQGDENAYILTAAGTGCAHATAFSITANDESKWVEIENMLVKYL